MSSKGSNQADDDPPEDERGQVQDTVVPDNVASAPRPPEEEPPVVAYAAAGTVESTRVTRSRVRQGLQSFVKQEDITEGTIQCPDCHLFIAVGDTGCNVITCQNHQPEFLYFCVHCKAIAPPGSEVIPCGCSRRNTRLTRSQARTERNRAAAANPIELELSSDDDDDDGEEEEEGNGGRDDQEQNRKEGEDEEEEGVQSANNGGSGDQEEIEKEGEKEQQENLSHEKVQGEGPITVEFKFCCMKASRFDDYEVEGTMWIPLLQDPQSGLFSLPPGESDVLGRLNGDGVRGNEDFKGRVKIDDDGRAFLELDFAREDIHNDGNPRSEELSETGTFRTYPDFEAETEVWDDDNDEDQDDNSNTVDLHKWASKAGGNIAFYHRSDQGPVKLLLYTVLSEKQPYQKKSKESGWPSVPNWRRLESMLVMRNTSWDEDTAKQATEQYKQFMRLKIKKKDFDSEMFAPSPMVDEVWHAHLAFNDIYLQDITAFAKQIRKKVRSPVVVKHCPFLYAATKKRYVKTYRNIQQPPDPYFWPAPTSLFPDEPEEKRTRSFTGCC